MSVQDDDGFGRDGGLTFEQRASLVRLDPDQAPHHVIEENRPHRPPRWQLALALIGLTFWALALALLAIDLIGNRP